MLEEDRAWEKGERDKQVYGSNLGELFIGEQLRAGLLGDRSECLCAQKQVLDENILEVRAFFGVETWGGRKAAKRDGSARPNFARRFLTLSTVMRGRQSRP